MMRVSEFTISEWITFLVIASAFAVGLVPLSRAQAPRPNWESVTGDRLQVPPEGEWLNYRRSYDVHGSSPLDEINRANVEDLRSVWAYPVQDNSRWVPTPIVANGLMYVAEGSGRVLAIDAATGEIVWIHRRAFPDDIRESQAFPNHRGVSIFENVIYWGTADSHLVALDARTGEQLWEVRTGDYRRGEGHSHPPLVADGKVLLGFLGGERELRGSMAAYDAATGDLMWRTYTVPGPGEPGAESWAESNMPPLGGATWGTASYDPELGLVYFGTGQPSPWASTLRGEGDALYTNSILAVEIESGEIAWHFQVVPADNWDMDSPYENVLAELQIDGVRRAVLIHTTKIGWGVVLDRATGEFIHAFRTAYDNIVTEWTGAGRPVFNPAVIPGPDDVDSDRIFEVCPHYHGARNLNAPSFDASTGLYYLGVNNSCMDVSFVSQEYQRGTAYTGMRLEKTKLAPGYDYVGEFVAFDPATGERRWAYRRPGGAAMTASALSTAGGIVFGGTADRYFFALDSATGELLWETRLNGDISGAPITFEADGRQYVAVGSGGRIAQTTSYAGLTDTDIPLGSGMMWVFALPD